MRKNFKDIDIFSGIKSVDGAAWQESNNIKANWKTPEHIEVKPVYTKEDLEGMDKQQLTLARNEIFARHGRLFSTAQIQEYFNKQSWYSGYIQPSNFDSIVLNDYERYNVAFISQYEDKL